jgi:hypothetical protein
MAGTHIPNVVLGIEYAFGVDLLGIDDRVVRIAFYLDVLDHVATLMLGTFHRLHPSLGRNDA